MAKFMSVVLFLLVVILAAAGVTVYTQNTSQVTVELLLGYTLKATLLELLGGAFGVGVLFGWIVVWTRTLRRARKSAAAPQAEESEPAPEPQETGAEDLPPELPDEGEPPVGESEGDSADTAD